MFCFSSVFSSLFLMSFLMGLNTGQPEQDNKAGEILDGTMINSCICKVNGKIYNLTETGKPNSSTPLIFPQTRELYYYLISICYPFNYPRTIRKTLNADQPSCIDASLCQFDRQEPRSNVNYYMMVTSQNYSHGLIECYLNKTSGLVHWTYKGIPPLFKNGGLKLTLNCPRNESKVRIEAVRDVDRKTGQNPWKFVILTHKCCCADRCYNATVPTTKPSKKQMNVYEEIGLYGGGCLILVIISLVGRRICNRITKKRPIIPRPYGDFDTIPHVLSVPVTVIDYSSIEDIRYVGCGTFGVVSKGMWKRTPVAVKRFKDFVVEEDIRSVRMEMTWLSKLAHKNIVQLYGICNLRPNICIVTEYMQKGSVGQIIHGCDSFNGNKKTLDWETRIKWATDAARGMIYLHTHQPQIIHRDLKSYNLLVDENDVVKIADFGTIKLVRPGLMIPKSKEVQEREFSKGDTRWVGTLRWSAPEVISIPSQPRTIEYNTKSDVFAFAMTFWEMMYNELPYHEYKFDYQIIDAILGGIRPDLRDCFPEVETFLDSWWHGNPDTRPEFTTILAQLETLRMVVTFTKPRTI